MDDDLVDFVFELGQLRRIKRSGWLRAGVASPESVAEHSLRAAQLAYVLAVMEGADPERAAAMVVFHDIGEARIGDLDRIQRRYVKADEADAVGEQLSRLGEAGERIQALWTSVESPSTPEALVAKDADRLEMAFTAREYADLGASSTRHWITSVEPLLKTASAKRVLAAVAARSASWSS